MFKRVLLLFLIVFSCAGFAFSQQITRFAVVDMPRVYNAFFRESRAVREYEERHARVLSDIQRYTQEIQALRGRHAEAVLQDNQSEALRLESQITRRTEFLREFHQIRIAELEEQRNRLMQSSSYWTQLQEEIRFFAESEGYSMVLNLKDNPSIIWYSHTVDITDKLIQSMQSRSRN
ncbi:MAG: OmpH family outer membrane protein [Treponema sp.]|nr:OmpH family outer membrane protein [Treponema sp.]